MAIYDKTYADSVLLTKIDDAYFGIGGYLTGTYLVQPSSESDAGYTTRKKLSAWDGNFKMCVDSNVNPLFATQPVRDYPKGDLVDQFVKDADSAGTPYELMIESLALDLKRFGTMLIVVDNFADLNADLGSNLAERKLPYFYTIRPDSIKWIKQDRVGGLVEVGYAETYLDADQKEQVGTRLWTKTNSTLFDKSEAIKIEDVEHKLGVLPCFFAYSGRNNIKKTPILSPSILPWLQTADMCYQMMSEMRVLMRKFSFAQLAVQGIIETNAEGKADISDMILQYSEDASNAPMWIEPNSSILKEIKDIRSDAISELFRMSGLDYRFGGANESGLAKKMAWEFAKLAFEELADSMSRTETKIFTLFGKWTGADYSTFTPIYSKTLGVDDAGERVDLGAKIATNFNDIPEVKAELAVESMKAYNKDLTEQELQVIYDSALALGQQTNLDASQSSDTPNAPDLGA